MPLSLPRGTRKYLSLLRSDLDPNQTTDAANWLATALGPFAQQIEFWCGQQDQGDEEAAVAAQFMTVFTTKTLETLTPARFNQSQVRWLSGLIDDERAVDAANKLWPYMWTWLGDRPDHSMIIIANEPLCRELAGLYIAAAPKPAIEPLRGKLLFTIIDLSKNWPHSISRTK